MKLTSRERRLFFYVFSGLVAYVAFLVLKPYLSLALLAFITAVVFKPIYKKFYKLMRRHRGLATFGAITTVFLLLLLPIVLVVQLTVSQLLEFNKDLVELAIGTELTLNNTLDKADRAATTFLGKPFEFDRELLTEKIKEVAQPVGKYVVARVIELGTSTPEFITELVLFIILLAGFFPLQDKFLKTIKQVSPLDDRLDALYIRRVLAMMESMVKGSFVIAVVQGVLAGVLLWAAGIKYVVFWTILMIFASIIPLGSSALIIPIGVVQLIFGNTWQGVMLIASSLVLSNVDNVLRPRLVSKDAYLHPALVLLGVFGGIRMFGFWGVVYGPVAMIFLTTTMEIYLKRVRVG